MFFVGEIHIFTVFTSMTIAIARLIISQIIRESGKLGTFGFSAFFTHLIARNAGHLFKVLKAKKLIS